ncbi:hypothetical protein NPX13_g854 [Xylaria arbuscula]|uniref:Glycosyltransferase family 2 protein n=1 Tax=Xylaria arbuscula TaxID=114810 RepID=A0A9W8NMR6_9PEZI|nr:hypothetical protein NPX13_g854 [Xylaria arbuscula]
MAATSSNMVPSTMLLFWALFVFRYLRTIVSIFVFLLVRPKPVKSLPKYTGKDVTVVIPTTFKSPSELIECLRSVTASSPSAIIIVTSNANVELLARHCRNNSVEVTVLGVSRLNKREQILRAMPFVKTEITVLADDDVFWPSRFLDYILAVFETQHWNFLGISYLERRVWNNLATNGIDGSISTLSGRTAAYRTKILNTDEFAHYFRNDSWKGKKIHTGDDKCLTRYVYSHGWKIVIQPDRRATIETTVEPDRKYVSQCIRWARSHWHGNFVVMGKESYWHSPRYLWGFYYIYVGQFQTPALLIDGLLFFFLLLSLGTTLSTTAILAYTGLGAWIFFTKLVKLIPHFCKYPSDMRFIPLSILFSYLHGFINLYALWTLDATTWGSQNLSQLEIARTDIGTTKSANEHDPLLEHV